jgi:hypothetical protein
VKPQVIAALTIALALPLRAGEGMWMPQQIPQLSSELKQAGLQLDPAQLSDLTGFPMGAVISLGGCTASFVSPEGLAVTNHHCAQSSIQYNSTPERDLLKNGFLAATKSDEVPAQPGSRIWVTTRIEDVTSRVTARITGKTSDLERYRLVDLHRKELVEECETAGGVKCTVPSFFEGSQFLRITQTEIRDVRLVYAPAGGVGVFGGETDNWMWPRHTGDFAFLRAYVGRDGKPADYSKENVPFRPEHWLKVSTEGIDEGDLVLVAGYPGRTYRFRTADEVRATQEFNTPIAIRYAKDLIALLEKENARGREIEIRNASMLRRLGNMMKNYEGTLEVFSTGKVLSHRENRERELASWIAADVARQRKYSKALAEIEKFNDELRSTRERDVVLSWMMRGSPMLGQAAKTYRLAIEKGKKNDVDRAAGYQERDWKTIEAASERAQKSIDPASDRAGLRYFLTEATKLPSNQRIAAVDRALAATGEATEERQIESLLDRLYSTEVGKLEVRQAMLKETRGGLDARKDPMMAFAAELEALSMQKESREQGIDGAMLRVRPLYLEALREMSGGRLFPDANSTLRITFGQVKGYRPRDAVWYTPQTTVEGILRKDSGEGDFESPKALLRAAKDEALRAGYIDRDLGTVPVNFLSNCDTTGGNSGSPTLNAKGELVGLLFDGNYEALGSDYLYENDLTRSIHVDAIYMLWVMDSVDKAHNLLHEMGLPVRTP